MPADTRITCVAKPPPATSAQTSPTASPTMTNPQNVNRRRIVRTTGGSSS